MITIRDYTDEDWPAICRVHDLARPHELHGSCDPLAFVPLAQDAEAAGDIYRSHKWVACEDDLVVAFAGVDGDYISWLYVDPACWRRGLGRRLLRLAIAEAGPTAYTVALINNTTARHLYESEGFKVAATFEGENAGYPCTCVRLALEKLLAEYVEDDKL
jgi:ribosomal protein S18 acetylase RimI-like enzyme